MRAAWEKTVVSFCSNMPDYEERLVSEIAKEKGVDSLDLALDLSLESDLTTRFRIPVANSNEDDIAILLKDPTTVLGLSDAGAHASQLCDACFSTHLLGHWVREKKVLSLEEAVRMLTSRPAEVFGIKDRGKLEKGAPADVVVFDPDTVGASALRRVHDLPAGEDRLIADAIGVTAVVVNGTLIRENGTDMLSAGDKLPGRLLRNGMAA